MFAELKKKKYQMDREATEKVLKDGVFGILSLLGENDYCYGVPLHHVYVDGNIYFHSALKGWKLDCAKHHPKVCYTVVDQKLMILDGEHDTRYTSVCAFGQASEVTDREEKMKVLRAVMAKYDPKSIPWNEEYVKGPMPVAIWKIAVEHMEGKSSFLEGDV